MRSKTTTRRDLIHFYFNVNVVAVNKYRIAIVHKIHLKPFLIVCYGLPEFVDLSRQQLLDRRLNIPNAVMHKTTFPANMYIC